MSRALALTLVLVLAAGCVNAPSAKVQPAATIPTVPADLKIEGATLTAVKDGVLATWGGNVTTRSQVLGFGPNNGQDDIKKLTIPAEVTAMEAWVNFSASGAPVFLDVRNKTATQCGAFSPDKGVDKCFATFFLPRKGSEEWSADVSAFDNSVASATPGTVAYQLTMFLRTTPLPILGVPAPFGKNASMQFDAPVLLSGSDSHTAEPSLAVTPKGVVYVSAPVDAQRALWRSEDGGKTFSEVKIHGTPTDPLSADPVGGGDSDVATAGESTVYFADQATGETVSASHDGGKTWFTQPFGAGLVPLDDRQWLVTDGDMTAWMAFNSLQGATVSKTLDGGHSWPIQTSMREDSCFRGNLARATDGTLYFAGCNADGPGVGVSTDGGLTWGWHQVAKRAPDEGSQGYQPHIFVIASTDAAGNAYLAWSDHGEKAGQKELQVYLSSSKDKGATWTKPQLVSMGAGNAVLPWVTGGADGHVAVSFYATKANGSVDELMGEWYPVVAESADATSEHATWTLSTVSDTPIQYGPICFAGSACGSARNLLDFFQIQADSKGMLHMAFVDGRAGGFYLYSNIMYAHQLGGMSLLSRSVDKDGVKSGLGLGQGISALGR